MDGATFPVVGLGASAGGVKALQTFFEALQTEEEAQQAAYMVILHLPPDKKSNLPHLLQRLTRQEVVEVTEPVVVRPGRIYVLRPNESLVIHNHRLEPQPRVPDERHHPVDDLFQSLGQEFGPRAVAVILSGAGSNGSVGLATVKENGGCVLVQAPDSADFAGMPQNAIATGLVDAVLPPERLPEAVRRVAEHLRSADRRAFEAETVEGEEEGAETTGAARAFDIILGLLRSHAGVDFRGYKRGTLQRRIDRRVNLLRLRDWRAYADLLRSKPEERDALAKDLLITVTGFFRDAEAWETLRVEVIRPLLREHPPGEPFRAWVAGCASGEEAYSLAILLFEEAKAQEKPIALDIFATDASASALARGRQGLYPAAAVDHLSAERLRGFFRKEDDSYRVKHELREAVVFAPQNLVQDPPFSRVKLVVCRNVLIYLKPQLQQKLLRLFHFALGKGGYLFLGSAENIGDSENLFDTVSKGWRIYRRLEVGRRDFVEFPIPDRARLPQQVAGYEGGAQQANAKLTEMALRALAGHYAPASVVIDRSMNVIYYHGATERYLRPQAGEPTNNLLDLAREGLGLHLRRLIEKSGKSKQRETGRSQITLDGSSVGVLLEVSPVERQSAGGLFVVSFVEQPEAAKRTAPRRKATSSREQDLENEVTMLREELRATVQSSSRAQEELKSYNEEIISMNEELRSTNEELETSKEELQSVNEELNTVNSQLRLNLEELQERTNDLNNLLTSTDVATLFLDSDLHIRWFSPGVTNLFNIRASDANRPISDLSSKFVDEGFAADCERVLRSLAPAEKHVRSTDDRTFVRRIGPYRTVEDRIDGVVVTFTDVTGIQRARDYAEQIVQTVPTPLVVLDSNLHVVSANPAFYRTFSLTPGETERRLVYDLGNGQWNIGELRRLLNEARADRGFSNQEVEHDFGDRGRRVLRLAGGQMDDMALILLAVEDVTEAKRAADHQVMLMAELSHRVKNALGVVQGLASQTLARSKSLADFRDVFEGRIAAYARGHSQLMEREWRSADLAHLIRQAVQAHAIDPGRVTMSGPAVEVSPKQALALNLTFHELETNAIKYGGLSDGKGRVEIAWTRGKDDGVHLVWQEVDGPPVIPPKSEGFGTRLISQLLQYEMKGTAKLSYEPKGMRCEIAFPAD